MIYSALVAVALLTCYLYRSNALVLVIWGMNAVMSANAIDTAWTRYKDSGGSGCNLQGPDSA